MANITITCETDILEKVNIITRQTDYTEIVAREKLVECYYDHIKVIKQFLGVTEKKEPAIKSINQEIYKQLRGKMNNSIREYNTKQEIKLKMEIENNNNK